MRRLELVELLAARPGAGPHLSKPISGPAEKPHALRVWLAGVTHEDSAKLREIEAKQATGDQVNVYEQKYRECADGGRPELFSKGEPDAVVGHNQPLTRPGDTDRLVPETELVSVYGLNKQGQVERLGYTGGNDATDNGIEAANPLNLPQAKNWADGCASLGPLLVTAQDYDDGAVEVSCEILREGQQVAYKKGATGQAHLNMPDGLFHMERMLFSRIPLQPGQFQVLYWFTGGGCGADDLFGRDRDTREPDCSPGGERAIGGTGPSLSLPDPEPKAEPAGHECQPSQRGNGTQSAHAGEAQGVETATE